MNNKKTITILKIIIALLILAACTPLAPTAEPSATYVTITPEPYPAWLTSWLEKPTCDIPCWETIVPGKTTRQEAKTALSKIKGITVIQEYEVSPYGQSLLWNRGAIFFDNNDIVHLIKLDTFYLNISLDSLLARYGSPKYVVIRDWDAGTVSVDLAYPENGLVIDLILHDLGKEPDNIKVNIMAKQEVADIFFVAPGLEHYYADPSVRQPLKQYDWKGYTSYP